MKKATQKKMYRGGVETVVFHTQVPQPRAEFAMALIEKHGIVACTPDGEDSSGRSKFRLQTPEELVSRSCEMADRAMSEFEKRGWMLDIPEPVMPRDVA